MQLSLHPRLSVAWLLTLLVSALTLVGCVSVPFASVPAKEPGRAASSAAVRVNAKVAARPAPALPAANSGRGGYYLDDGPGEIAPEGLQALPDAEPRIEPYSSRGNRPYVVFGKKYTPIADNRPLTQRGIGSWYGKKFHGQKTSSGELYDMYKMTAAHPTLPIPSYARVTNVATGDQVIVRINDRGPFHAGRIIDLSYTAALKLGYLRKGSSELEVERILPDEIARMTTGKSAPRSAQAVPAAAPPTSQLVVEAMLREDANPEPTFPAAGSQPANATLN